MKKVIVVAQSHWDKEWYFNEQTSHINLQRMANDIKSKNGFPFHLDGQSSLLDDLFPGNKEKASAFVRGYKLTAGPMFIQQDNLNILFGTTQNNLEISNRIVDEDLLSKTIYIPDSFGFNEQMPQVFKKNGFENIVFWRGIKPEDQSKSNIFNWKGIDGTNMNAHCMVNGYWIMGSHYPYFGELNKENFHEELIKHAKKLASFSDQNIYVIPLGGDQAPVPFEAPKYIELANKMQDEFKFELGGYDDYFKELTTRPTETIDYMLYYSGTSKIHRTVHSNRYDIKKAYREAEISTFYRMEPLEIIYRKMGGTTISQEVKDQRIYKPLVRSSGHDGLCGCNLDQTNENVVNRLIQVKEFAESYIDQMLRDIRENLNKENVYIAFNQAPFKRDLVFKDIISTRTAKPLSSADGQILEYGLENLSNGDSEDVFMHKVWIVAKDVEPLSWKIINVFQVDKSEAQEQILTDKITDGKIKVGKEEIEIIVEDDLGDEFDFSTNATAKKEVVTDWNVIRKLQWNNETNISWIQSVKYPELIIELFNYKEDTKFNISLENKFKDKRLSIKMPKDKLHLSRHLAFITESLDDIPNWKEQGHKDFPLNSFPNDGLVRVDERLNILTKGTNEVFIDKDSFSITLARFVGLMGKPNLDYRPGVTSGLPFKAYTPGAQLNQRLEFNFAFTYGNPIADLNSWYFDPIGFYSKHANPVVERLDKFIWNNRKLNLDQKINIAIDKDKYLVGIFRFNESKNAVDIIYSNPCNENDASVKKFEIIYEEHKI